MKKIIAICFIMAVLPSYAFAQSVQQEFTFTVTAQEGAILAAALRKAPLSYEIVAPVIEKLQKQANEQASKAVPKQPEADAPK